MNTIDSVQNFLGHVVDFPGREGEVLSPCKVAPRAVEVSRFLGQITIRQEQASMKVSVREITYKELGEGALPKKPGTLKIVSAEVIRAVLRAKFSRTEVKDLAYPYIERDEEGAVRNCLGFIQPTVPTAPGDSWLDEQKRINIEGATGNILRLLQEEPDIRAATPYPIKIYEPLAVAHHDNTADGSVKPAIKLPPQKHILRVERETVPNKNLSAAYGLPMFASRPTEIHVSPDLTPNTIIVVHPDDLRAAALLGHPVLQQMVILGELVRESRQRKTHNTVLGGRSLATISAENLLGDHF